ncbi:MAG: purine-nucleoside phosphorylase [Chloroflexi bacterium]|nr:purine-nucleoside phosphorylase [Chloroflexota bacterium]
MLTPAFTRADYEAAADEIRRRTPRAPKIGIILGSGLGPLADSVENAVAISYRDIPNWPQAPHGGHVQGHKGQLVIGSFEGQDVVMMQGRLHFYEGYNMHQVTFPVRLMRVLGVDTLVVTNAAGGLNENFKAGDLMLITDHINLLGQMGNNGLIGPNDDSFGDRFPIFTQAYDKKLRNKAIEIAQREGITLRQGVYIALSGPAFETPAEIRMFRMWGADAVGMSTVPEVVVARHAGMRVLGVSSITNEAIDNQDSTKDVSHQEVLDVGAKIVPNLVKIIRGVIREFPE